MDQGSPSTPAVEELSPLQSRANTDRAFTWVPYAVAASLMLVAMVQAVRIFALKAVLQSTQTELARSDASNTMLSLRVSIFEVRDPALQAARIAVAWDPYQHHGVITTHNLPAPAAGHNYQLWVLDPGAQTPFNAGVIQTDKASATFEVKSLSTLNPGFAISLEPAGGSPEPTGAILFAVEPAQ